MKNIININKIFLKCCSAALLILILAASTFAGQAPDRRSGKIPGNIQSLAPVNNVFMQPNNINTCVRSDGIFNYDKITFTAAIAGLIWPVSSSSRLACDYATGVWIGAKVNGELRTAVSLYNSIFTPGNIPVPGSVPPGSVCADPRFKAYHVNLTDPNLVNGGTVQKVAGGHTFVITFDAWSTWPIDLGAPYVEVNGIPGYQPGPGGDRPGIGNSDATPDEIVYVSYMDYSNCTNNVHNHEISLPGGTLPLGVEIHQVAFGFNSPGLQNMYFSKFWIINKSANRWDSTYSCIVNDVDLGDANDDAVGCDSAVSLGFIYNADNSDPEYGANPPATGSKYLQGPLIYTGNPNDIVYLPYDTLIGYVEQGMTGFNVFQNINDPCKGDPDNAIAGYNFMRGFDGCGVPTHNWVKGFNTRYAYNTDSTYGYCSGTRRGWYDSSSSDRRFIQASGPFTMNANDTQVVVIGLFVERGGDNIQSVCRLIQNSSVVQKIYDKNFHAIPLPSPPQVKSVADGDGNISLYWGDTSEFYHTYDFIDSTGFWTFQGYEVYQIRPGTGGDNPEDRSLLAVFDVIDSIDLNGAHVYDSILVAQPNGENQIEYIPVTYGSNSGVSRIITMSHNRYPNGANDFFINGSTYKFSVVAYGVNTGRNHNTGSSSNGFKVLKNPISAQVISVTPNFPMMGTSFINKNLDTLVSNRTDRSFMPIVVDPKKVITARYQMVWTTDSSWNIVRIMNSQVDTIGKNSMNVSYLDNKAFILDGIQFKADSITKVNYGVIHDPGPGAQTSGKGWTYTGGAVNLTGYDTTNINVNYPGNNFIGMQSMSMGLSWLNLNTFKLNLRSAIDSQYVKTYALPRVRINFGQTQKAYRWMGRLNTSPYVDFVDVPFTVEMFDPLDTAMTTPRQLNCGFYDGDSSGTWNPKATPEGGFEHLYIFNSNYSSSPLAFYTSKNVAFPTHVRQMDILYVWWPRLINAGPAYTNGDVLTIIPYTKLRHYTTPGFPLIAEVSTTAPTLANIDQAKNNGELENVRVVPNPYYGGHSQETSTTDRFVKFMRMPKTANIFIYSLNGNLVRKLVKDDNTTTINWDLLNTDAIPVASGIYIAYINAPGIGTKIIKMAIFTPEERLQSF